MNGGLKKDKILGDYISKYVANPKINIFWNFVKYVGT